MISRVTGAVNPRLTSLPWPGPRYCRRVSSPKSTSGGTRERARATQRARKSGALSSARTSGGKARTSGRASAADAHSSARAGRIGVHSSERTGTRTRSNATSAGRTGVRPRAKSENASSRASRAIEIERRLTSAIPEARCELDHDDAWQLLVATILSAQSTDRTVNRVTPQLFARYPTAAALAAAPQSEIEALIKATGFFRNKAKAIRAASQLLADRYAGVVPRTLEALIELPGVARKTANVVLGTAYRIASGMTVDTHAGRVARRLQLTQHDDPVHVERDLCALFAVSSWIDMGHRFVLHGRYVCLARKPRCSECPLAEVCPASESAAPSGTWTERAERERGRVEARGEAPSTD